MASALVPVLLGLAPDLIKLIASIVHKEVPQAEANRGPGTGPLKQADVFGAVITALQSLAAAGTIPKQLPSDETIKLIIEAVFNSMKLSGTVTAAPSNTVTVPAGQSVRLTFSVE